MCSSDLYTEFSYMLLQSFDFLMLRRLHGVELQMGGSDQWGNITAGTELIRRVDGAGVTSPLAFGLCYPLLLTKSGDKFGKTADGAVWLDPAQTSPYAFHQFWMDLDDDEVRAVHESVVSAGGFGVPTLRFPDGQLFYGPVVLDPPTGDAALRLWSAITAWLEFPGLYEIKRPKSAADERAIAEAFRPYLEARDWVSIDQIGRAHV